MKQLEEKKKVQDVAKASRMKQLKNQRVLDKEAKQAKKEVAYLPLASVPSTDDSPLVRSKRGRKSVKHFSDIQYHPSKGYRLTEEVAKSRPEYAKSVSGSPPPKISPCAPYAFYWHITTVIRWLVAMTMTTCAVRNAETGLPLKTTRQESWKTNLRLSQDRKSQRRIYQLPNPRRTWKILSPIGQPLVQRRHGKI